MDSARLLHFHLAKTAGKSIFSAMHDYLSDAAVNFAIRKQEKFIDKLRDINWKVVSGHFSGAHSKTRNVLFNYPRFTILRDPVGRFYSGYRYTRLTKESGLHGTFSNMSPEEAAVFCVENKLDYGANSQCSGIIWREDELKNTAENALDIIDRRYAFVATIEQIPKAARFMAEAGLIRSTESIPLLNKTNPLPIHLHQKLTEILSPNVNEDAKLHRHIRDNGPCGNEEMLAWVRSNTNRTDLHAVNRRNIGLRL